jgi:hypothetical protein
MEEEYLLFRVKHDDTGLVIYVEAYSREELKEYLSEMGFDGWKWSIEKSTSEYEMGFND